MEREPARDDIISLKVKPSTVTKAQERETHTPDQHLTTSDMSSSETYELFKQSFHASPLFLHTGKDLHAICNYHREMHLPGEICYLSV